MNSKGFRFTDSQKDLIMRLHPVLSNKEIAEIMGCSVSTIEMFAYRNGMIKAKNEGIITPAIVERGRHHRYIVSQTPYWDLVKQYKQETPTRQFNHPFYEPTKKQFKPKENGTD
jgi:DNA-binding CsgD family transcriptional regulator